MSIVRSATRRVPCTLPLAAGVLLSGCSIEAPELPSFQTQIRIPITQERYTLAELVEDVEGVVVDTGDVRIELSGEIDPVGVDDDLAVSVSSTSFAAEIGAFDLPGDLGAGVAFGFEELAPPATPTGDTVVPPFSFAPPTRDASGIDSFTEVTFASGELVVQITNDLPVPLSGSCGPLAILARDASTSAEILNATILAEIAPGETVEVRSDLTGKTMGRTLRLTFTGCSAGSGGNVVTVADTDEVSVGVSFDGVTAERAVAAVPAQSFGTTGTSDWDADMALTAAAILSGVATFSLNNPSALDATVQLRFPGFTTTSGDTLGFDLPLLAGTQDTATLDFTGVTFYSPLPVTEVRYETRVVTPGSGTAHVAVESTDAVSVEAGDFDLELDWIEGVPDGIERTFGPFTEEIEWPDEADGFRPAIASIGFDIVSELGGPASGEIVVRGVAEAGADTVVSHVTVQPGAPDDPTSTSFLIDETNSRILDIFALVPTEIEISGTFTVGDGASVVRVDRGAEIAGTYTITAPFAFTVEGGEVELDAIDVELDADMRELLLENVGSIAMETTLSNGFPFGATVVLSFSTDSTEVYTAPMVVLDALSAGSAEVDPVSGKTVEPTMSGDLLRMSAEEVDTLARPDLYVGVDIRYEPSEGVIVMSPDDEIVVTMVLTMDVAVDEGIFDGDEADGGGGDE